VMLEAASWRSFEMVQPAREFLVGPTVLENQTARQFAIEHFVDRELKQQRVDREDQHTNEQGGEGESRESTTEPLRPIASVSPRSVPEARAPSHGAAAKRLYERLGFCTDYTNRIAGQEYFHMARSLSCTKASGPRFEAGGTCSSAA
jgi:hypothetical protein